MKGRERKSTEDFFASLYADQKEIGELGRFDSTVTSLVAQKGDKLIAGDQALQSLMFNYVLSSAENAKKGQPIVAALAGIKMRSVHEFLETFPKTNIDSLISAAKEAGYNVDVLRK